MKWMDLTGVNSKDLLIIQRRKEKAVNENRKEFELNGMDIVQLMFGTLIMDTKKQYKQGEKKTWKYSRHLSPSMTETQKE